MHDSVDLFAGIGGWGAHMGFESDDDVVATRRACGLETIQVDVSRVPPRAMPPSTGQCASPPCPPFSATGNGEGRKDLELLAAGARDLGIGRDCRPDVRESAEDPRSVLSLEPLRWALAVEPEWVAWEQVIGALPVWEACAQVLADRQYSVWVGIMDAWDYGSPQTRRRAILMAHRSRLVSKPSPIEPRLVLEDVLGNWGPEGMVLRMGRSRGTARRLDQPSPTMMFGKSPSGVAWYGPGGDLIRPISLEEALIIQGFPADYALRGGKISQYRQIGNAVPRPMAEAILGALR